MPASAQTTEEILSQMEDSNIPPGYFDSAPSPTIGNYLCAYKPGPFCAFRSVLRSNRAGSLLETNPNDPADNNGDAMKDSSYPYMLDTWRDNDYDAIPDQSYDDSFYNDYEVDTNSDGIYDWSSFDEYSF
ncbi:MAG: hypothetical protein AAFY72_05200 [Cyanobacteria bacterium J06649_4]